MMARSSSRGGSPQPPLSHYRQYYPQWNNMSRVVPTAIHNSPANGHCHGFASPERMPPPPPTRKILPAKSPMSQCIDTIIGAAEVVDRQEIQQQQEGGQKKRGPSSSNGSAPSSKSESSHESDSDDPLKKALEDEDFVRKLVLTMALQRHSRPRDPPTHTPPRTIQEGFYWKDYPVLESILFMHMEEYYEWSMKERQSKHQQAFNNALVNKCRRVAAADGLEFCPRHFTDRRLRDRIRCYFKTHLQNAKKRLHTLLKHLDRPDTRSTLRDLMEETRNRVPSSLPRLVSCNDDDEEEEEERQETNVDVREESDAKRVCVRN